MPHRTLCSFVISYLCRVFSSCVHGRVGGPGRVCLAFFDNFFVPDFFDKNHIALENPPGSGNEGSIGCGCTHRANSQQEGEKKLL